ncbi:MAG: hypothetical protein AB7E96_05240 [Deferribacterales bacterium]
MSEDNNNEPLSFQDFYNIKLKRFYEFVTEVMHDFTFAVHRTIKEEDNKRRIELWKSSRNEAESAMVWIELVKNEENVDRYVSTDVLRTMNEEGLTKLFFFSNTDLDKDTRDVLDGKNHYIFTPSDIMETIDALERKKTVKVVKKRKQVKIPSGFLHIRNHLKQHPPQGKKVFVNTSTISAMSEHYIDMVRQVVNEIDRIDDINNMPQELKDKFKRVQAKLLPEMRKTLYFKFTDRFEYLSHTIYSIIENLIVYIGAIIEMEAEEDLHKYRDKIEEHLETLRQTDERLEEFYAEQMNKAESLSYKLLYYSIAVIVFMTVFYIIMRLKK